MANQPFIRFARFLNFRRSFPTPVSTVTRIPTLPIEAFDNAGAKIQPSSLATLVNATRIFSFAKGGNLDCPDKSFIDADKLINDYYIFVVRASMRIEKEFHRLESPKFPLYIRTTVYELGNSSKSLLYELFHEGSDTLYATVDLTDVLVSQATRKTVRYPDWWLDKYAAHMAEFKSRPPVVEEPGNHAYSSSLKVRNSETDDYFHVSWPTFIQYSCDNIYDGISSKAFPNLNKSHWYSGFKSVDMTFKAEADCRDTLQVESWENSNQEHSASSRVRNGQNLCFYANFTFFADN